MWLGQYVFHFISNKPVKASGRPSWMRDKLNAKSSVCMECNETQFPYESVSGVIKLFSKILAIKLETSSCDSGVWTLYACMANFPHGLWKLYNFKVRRCHFPANLPFSKESYPALPPFGLVLVVASGVWWARENDQHVIATSQVLTNQNEGQSLPANGGAQKWLP